MRQLNIELENCYGIQKMKHTIDFNEKNIAIIYAPNGTMKSSLANTFRARKANADPEERIYGEKSRYKITDENGNDVFGERIMVLNPIEEVTDDATQGLLMANEELRKKYILIYKRIEELKAILYQQLKANMGYTTRSSFDVENTLLQDWGYDKNKLFQCMEDIYKVLYSSDMACSLSADAINYKMMFNENVYKVFASGGTYELINSYEQKYNELVEKSLYMQKGIIDHNNYDNIGDSLNSNRFFGAKNEVILNAKDGSGFKKIASYEEYKRIIKQEKDKILNTQALRDIFNQINDVFKKNKETRDFNSFLQKNPDVIVELNDFDKFKKKIWIKAFLKAETAFKGLLDSYRKAQSELKILRETAQKERTDWEKALEIFKNRFVVPFKIELGNQEDVILSKDMPSFKYVFGNDKEGKVVTKDNLLAVLSTGERRAYYILNMLFSVLVAEKDGKEKLVIMDDVSESFDYKNKHAIIEYISDMSKCKGVNGQKIFKVILLTHNFDFYRTVASRLGIRKNSYIAYNDNKEIKFEECKYTKTLFGYFKERITKGEEKYIIAAIPFVRNLIEYTEGNQDVDYLKLTNILHYKEDTKTLTLMDVQGVFNKYWFKSGGATFAVGRESDLIYDFIIRQANSIECVEKLEIENKLILSMAIRLLAEEIMIKRIRENVLNGQQIISDILSDNSQTGALISAYKESISDGFVPILEQVSMFTPENIHLNSFMFEPILDMSLVHLHKLYEKVRDVYATEFGVSV